mmetsp:Transcript_14898/g.44978  ORF Transcript_14898/g.44978 Transcript_14898/m.44978 type:complete len:283 (+) Transcript_14898:1181-2029(+)|eukprot:CAMPEP_0206135998 /NCGR_PEP_ID=MMETSP1473-20131121/1229_1 /ASSEMBLY_ACC=CAM_ASM_001109 /TAXON_ID=1461547 /ORGANISM="Stichococcus sp, Strain RCC1054" /LENGTH=282 /DNA_ID=CAMNT_0053528197 /DNA_START=1121 /DNA_END=1969 /DNA_ORIENTATION=-
MASKLQQTLAEFRSKQSNLQSQQVKEANKRKAAADREKRKKKAAEKAKLAPPPVAAAKPLGAREKQLLGKRQKAVLDFLRENRGPHSADEIAAGTPTRERVDTDAQLAAAVAANQKIEVHSNGTYSYKPLYEIPDRDELLTLLIAAGEKGLRQDDVDDSYQGIVADIAKLQDKKRIYAVYHAELRTTVLYARDAHLDAEVTYSEPLAAVWRKAVIPSEHDAFMRELQKAGISPAPRTKEFKRAKLAPRERKKRKQRVNLETATNAHLPHLLMGAMPEGIDQR